MAPELDEVYARAPQVLLPVLASLARMGYPLAPRDGLDLVHSFIADHWVRLTETYDEEVGPFEPYLRIAFDRYVRRSSLQLARQRARLLDPASLQDLMVESESLYSAHELGHLRDALDGLPRSVRALLRTFFDADSERSAAAGLGWSRHRFRSALGEAVARLALQFGRPPHISTTAWNVTKQVLGSGRTVAEAAELLDIDRIEARRLYQATLSSFLGALHRAS